MPFAKCKFYTESGEPVRGGCHRKGAGCTFIHPDDPNWNKARPALFKAKESDDSERFKSWDERNNRSAAAIPSGWDTGGNASPSATDIVSGGGWDTGSGWGAKTGTGWGTGSGWGTEDSISTPNQVPEPARPMTSPTTKSWGTSASTNGWGQADAAPTSKEHTKSGENGWGGGADKATGSGWGSTGNGTWGTSDLGNAQGADKATESGWGSIQNDKWGKSWGDSKDAGSAWGSTRNDGWGAGWGNNKDATNSWGAADPMIVDNQAERETEQKKRTRKAAPAPPRIRIPDNENKITKLTGTNNETLGANKWGNSHISNLVTASTPATIATPITPSTPTDSTRVKRKRDVAFGDKLDVFKEYVKYWERGVNARFLLAEAEAKRDHWFCTQKSACYSRIGGAGRKRLDGQRAECDKEVNSQREKLSAAITSLVKFHDAISSKLDLGQHYNIGEEAQKFIGESRAFVDEIRALLVTQVLKDKNDVRSDDTQKHPSEANPASMDILRSRFRDLEERFDQAQAELTLRHRRDIHSEIDELLAAKIADLRVARQREINRIASQPRPEIVIPPAALMKTEETAQQVRELDARVPQTVDDIRVLLLRVDATTKRVNELEEELATNKETYRKMQEMAAEKEEVVRRVDERLEKIRDQFEQLVASQPPGVAAQPAVSPTTYNSQDKLMESLRPAFEAILDKFFEQEVRPTIESMQQNVVNTSDRLQEEAIQVLWGRIEPAMHMVAGVSRWLDSQELVHTAPVEEDRTSGRHS